MDILQQKRFIELNFEKAPLLSSIPPGPKARNQLERQRRVDSAVLTYPNSVPLAPVRGLGATVMDADENIFIDLSAGLGALNVGHSNPAVVAAINRQVALMTHSLDFPAQARLELSEKLAGIAPGQLRENCKVFLSGPTGADAVDAAVKLAKYVSKKPTVIAFEGGWHGVCGIGLSASGKRSVRSAFLPAIPEVYHVPYPYCYRCAFGMTFPECDLQCARYLEHVVRDPDSGATAPGCVLIEPIQGEGGIVVPPPGYLDKVRRICDEYGLVMIIDEIQTGFGRAGSMFACELEGVTPDILCLSKTLGGGLPLAAIVFRKELDIWPSGSHVGTFRGNLLSSAAGLAAIEFIEREKLDAYSAELGAQALERLNKFAIKSEIIGDVRGRGLFIGVEFVKDKKTKEPAPDILEKVLKGCFERGVVFWKAGRWYNVARIMPALVITASLMNQALDIFEDVSKYVERNC